MYTINTSALTMYVFGQSNAGDSADDIYSTIEFAVLATTQVGHSLTSHWSPRVSSYVTCSIQRKTITTWS